MSKWRKYKARCSALVYQDFLMERGIWPFKRNTRFVSRPILYNIDAGPGLMAWLPAPGAESLFGLDRAQDANWSIREQRPLTMEDIVNAMQHF